MRSPIFIVGTARSGTTLLARMLSAHPAIFIKNEIPGVRLIFNRHAAEKEIFSSFDHEMAKFYGYNLHTFMKRENKKRWGLKDPELTYCLHCLEKNFMDAKVIFIQRDGRGVVNSYLKSKWGLGTTPYTGAVRWVKEIAMQQSFYKAHPNRSYWIKYEDLLTNTHEEINKLLVFLEEPFSKDILNYYKQPGYIQKKSHSKNTFKKLDIEIANKWQIELNQKQINIVEEIAGDTLIRSGYGLIGQKINISTLERCFYMLHQKIVGEIQLQYQLKIGKKFK